MPAWCASAILSRASLNSASSMAAGRRLMAISSWIALVSGKRRWHVGAFGHLWHPGGRDLALRRTDHLRAATESPCHGWTLVSALSSP